MKKILSLLAAGALALGLIGCSGDLHDSEEIDMSKLFLRGNMNAWGATAIEAGIGAYEGKYVVDFTAAATETQFAIATNDASWTTAYRMTKEGGTDCAAYAADDLITATPSTVAELDELLSAKNSSKEDVFKELYHGGGMSNATIATEIGTDYKVVITTDAGFIKVAIIKGEAPKTAFVSVNGEMAQMELLEKGSYKYAIKAVSGTKLDFQVLYDGEVYGASTASVSVDTAVTLTKASPKVISAAVEDGEPYNILLDTTETAPKLTVEYASYKAFIAGGMNDNWSFARMPVYIKGKNITTYTFKAPDSEVGFKIKKVGNWTSDDDNLYTGAELSVNGGFESNEGDNKDCKITGLEKDSTYTLILDASDPDDLQCAVVGGSYALYIAGGMNSWNFATTGLLPGDDTGAYYEFKEDVTDCEFKVKDAPTWDYGTEVFFGATVTTSETVCGTENNGKVTAAAGDKLYVYKNAAGKWCAKLVAKQ